MLSLERRQSKQTNQSTARPALRPCGGGSLGSLPLDILWTAARAQKGMVVPPRSPGLLIMSIENRQLYRTRAPFHRQVSNDRASAFSSPFPQDGPLSASSFCFPSPLSNPHTQSFRILRALKSFACQFWHISFLSVYPGCIIFNTIHSLVLVLLGTRISSGGITLFPRDLHTSSISDTENAFVKDDRSGRDRGPLLGCPGRLLHRPRHCVSHTEEYVWHTLPLYEARCSETLT